MRLYPTEGLISLMLFINKATLHKKSYKYCMCTYDKGIECYGRREGELKGGRSVTERTKTLKCVFYASNTEMKIHQLRSKYAHNYLKTCLRQNSCLKMQKRWRNS